MRPPRFWTNPPEAPGWQARLLAPLGWIWARATARRLARGARLRPGVPVICVGNLTVGGTGKTPTAQMLVTRLVARGRAVHVISRGHGGRLEGPLRVDERAHTAADVGDEPLLLAPFAPVWIGADRAASARAAVAAGAEALVMDDGFQNADLAQDLAIIVVDAEVGFGNGRVLPAGPLREPVETGLARAGLLLAIGPEPARARFAAAWPGVGPAARLEGRLAPLVTGMDWKGLRAFAFAGIGRPEKFFATLRAEGAEVVATRSFDDHAPYEARILARLLAEAGRLGARLVTTEKDAARLPPAFRAEVLTLPVRLVLEDEAPLDEALAALGL
jgi:tetraacyldisaccharide 4'-kinase